MKEVDNFLEELVLKKNLSNSTVIAYEKDLKDYINYAEEQNIDIFKVSEPDFKEYFEYLKYKFKAMSIKRKYSAIVSFYKYLWKNRLVDKVCEYNLELTVKENIKDRKNKFSEEETDRKLSYEEFINSLEDNLYDSRFKVISMLVAELNINLVNIFEIQIRDLLKYDFKKIVISRDNKIFSYDLNKNVENELKNYYKKYAQEKRFLFSKYNIQAFRNDLKRFNLTLADLKKALVEDEESIYENIKKLYFEIGIGDK